METRIKSLQWLKAVLLVILLSVLILVSSCEKNDLLDIELRLNDTLTIKAGSTIPDNTRNVSLSFDSLVAECRCPSDVVCIWEGYASVALRFFSENKEQRFVLSTLNFNPLRNDTTISGYTIKLIDVLPYPNTKIHTDPKEITVKIQVTHK
jgi:hypothetical protein